MILIYRDDLDNDSVDMVDDSIDMIDDISDVNDPSSIDPDDIVDDIYGDNGFDENPDMIGDSNDDPMIDGGMDDSVYGDEAIADAESQDWYTDGGNMVSDDNDNDDIDLVGGYITPTSTMFLPELNMDNLDSSGDDSIDMVDNLYTPSSLFIPELNMDNYTPNSSDDGIDMIGSDDTQAEVDATPSGLPISMEYGDGDDISNQLEFEATPSDYLFQWIMVMMDQIILKVLILHQSLF